jgi:serine/threonine protein kinase
VTEQYPADMPGFKPGSMLAGYRLEAKVGSGGMAVVYRARDERLRRPVALKILAPQFLSDQEFRRRFIGESLAAAAVDDPHIIPVYGAGEADGVLFIAMRFVNGGDLRLVLNREGVLSPAQATDVVSPVASALDAAHNAGLVHRDVKPGNVLVDTGPGRPDHVYLSDFGISKSASAVTLTGTGQFFGTPGYSAPEQVEGRNDVDGRADQYALACVTYELLTAQTPFQHRNGMMSMLVAHVHEAPPALTSRNADLPAAADDVMAKALAKSPDDRYETCADFADALRDALDLPSYHPHRRPAVRPQPQPHDDLSLGTDSPPSTPTPRTPAPSPPAPRTPTSVPPGNRTPTVLSGPITPWTDEPSAAPADDVSVPDDDPSPTMTVAAVLRTDRTPGPAKPVAAPEPVAVPEHVAAPEQVAEPEPAAEPEPVAAREPTMLAESIAPASGPASVDGAAAEPEDDTRAVDAITDSAPATARMPPPDTAYLTAVVPAATANPLLADTAIAPAPEQQAPEPAEQEQPQPGLAAPDRAAPERPAADLPEPEEPAPELSAPEVVQVELPESQQAEPERAEREEPEPEPPAADLPQPQEPEPREPDGEARTPRTLVAGPETELSEASQPAPPDAGTRTLAATLRMGDGDGAPAEDKTWLAGTQVVERPGTGFDPGPLRPDASAANIWRRRLPVLAAAGVLIVAAAAVLPFVLKSPAKSPEPKSSLTAPAPTTATAAAHATATPPGALSFHATRLGLPAGYQASSITSLAFNPASSPADQTLAIAGAGTCLWDVATARCTAQFAAVRAVAFNAAGTTLVASGSNGVNLNPFILLVNVPAKKQFVYLNINDTGIPTSGVNSVAFSRDNKTVAVGDLDGVIYLWNAVTKKSATHFQDPTGVNAVAFTPDGKVLATGDGSGSTYLWNVATGKARAPLTGIRNNDINSVGVAALAVSPDGKTLAVAEDSGNIHQVYLWDIATGKLIAPPLADPKSAGVTSVAFSHNGATLAVGDGNGFAYLWNVGTGKVTASLRDPGGKAVVAVAFSPSGGTLATGDEGGSVYVWSES